MNEWKLLWPRTKFYTVWSLISQGDWSRILLSQSSPLSFNLRSLCTHIQCGCTCFFPLPITLSLALPFPFCPSNREPSSSWPYEPTAPAFSTRAPCLQRTEVAQRFLKQAVRLWRNQANKNKENFFSHLEGAGGKGKENPRDWGFESEAAEHTG